MINQMLEEAVVGNYTSFAELFKKELNERLHEAIEGKKKSIVDATHNVCESCEDEELEDTIDEGKKKAKKDHDGDGKIETSTQEFMGSRDKAIKAAIASRGGN